MYGVCSGPGWDMCAQGHGEELVKELRRWNGSGL